MKRKVEKYLYSKNIDGVHRLKDAEDRYLVGTDIEGCLRAARQAPASHSASATISRSSIHPTPPLNIKVGMVRPSCDSTAGAATTLTTPSTAGSSTRKKRKSDQLNSLFSPAIAPSLVKSLSSTMAERIGGSTCNSSSSVGATKTTTPTGRAPAVAAAAAAAAAAADTLQASASDQQQLADFCRTLRGGYDVNGVYRSAVERRKMAENTAKCGVGKMALVGALNALNLSVNERSSLPSFYKEHVLKLLAEYKAPPPPKESTSASTTTTSTLLNSARKEQPHPPPSTPSFHLVGFDGMIANTPAGSRGRLTPSVNSLKKVLLQPQLRPSPVTSKSQRETFDALAFNPFSPATRKMTEEAAVAAAASTSGRSRSSSTHHLDSSSHMDTSAATPERIMLDSSSSGLPPVPGSAFSSFSPFISPNYMAAVMSDPMTMTPAGNIIDGSSVQHSLEVPPSWEAVDSKMLSASFSFGETPSRKLDAFLEATGTGPKLPSTEELARPLPKLSHYDDDDDEKDELPIINTTFSFSDVLSPTKHHDDEIDKVHATAVTDSGHGPLRMRLKATSTDFSTHHFDAWQSPIGNLSQEMTSIIGTRSKSTTTGAKKGSIWKRRGSKTTGDDDDHHD